MATYEAGRAETELAALTSTLMLWHQNPDSIHDRHQSHELDFAMEAMPRLIEAVQPEQRLQLCVGETAVKGTLLSYRTGYKVAVGMNARELEPGSKLELRKAITIVSALGREMYAGWTIKMPLSEIARTLTEGGELSVVEAPFADDGTQ